MEKPIIYFEKPGVQNTRRTIEAAVERAKELGIRDVVVASTHGATAQEAWEAFGDPSLNLVAVTICEGYSDLGWCMLEDEKERLRKKGMKVLTAVHALGDGVGSAFAEKYGGKPTEEIVRDAFYRFGQGMKVCVEVVLMAADSGLIDMDGEVMAIAGTGEGADTCIVVKPAYPRTFFDMEIREIVAKPRDLS